MKRILFVANNMAGGGAEKVLLTLLHELRPPEYGIDLLLIKNEGIYMKAIPEYVTVMTMINDAFGDSVFPCGRPTLEEFCNQNLSNGYDVEIAFLEGPPTKLLACHKNTNAKKIAWVHTDMQNVHWTYAYYESDMEERATYEAFHQIVFVSEGAKRGFQRRFGIPAIPLSVIINPINCDDIRKKACAYAVASYPFTLCTVASLCARKGQSRLLHAVGRLVSEGFSIHLYLIGEGNNSAFLHELAHVLNISEFVHFTGFCENPYPYMANADLVVSSSVGEGFPLVLCEALCLHRPIIATDCAGNRDVLQGGNFGYLTPNSKEGIYRGIRRCLENDSFLIELRHRAERGAGSLHYGTIIEEICALF